MIIAVDFDDTITESAEYPIMGKIRPEAVRVLKRLKEAGHILILWTCREGKYLEEAVNALIDNDVYFDRVNENYISAETRKIIADLYIDDRALGGITDWNSIEKYLLR